MLKFTKLGLTITAGCLVFIGILFISAYWDPSIRWLHFFQAWLYIAVVYLAFRQNRWGYFLGIVTAAFWDYTVLFVNNFFHSGRVQLDILLTTGTLPRPDLLIAVPAVLANLLVIVGCVWGYLRLTKHDWKDVGRLLVSGSVSIGYFACIMALFQPRYLALFGRLLSPHLNF